MPLKLERFKHSFFSHLRGGINCASHLALISGSVSRISSIVVGNWLETPLSEPGTLPSRRLVCHSTDVLCSWCKTLFEIWKHPAFLLCGQGNPSFLPLHWDPPRGTDVRIYLKSWCESDKAKFWSGLYPRSSTEATQLNRCNSEKNKKLALSQHCKFKASFYPMFSFCSPTSQWLQFCSGSATMHRAHCGMGTAVWTSWILGLKADQKYPQGQLCKCSGFRSGARVLQSAHYKSCGKCDSVAKCLNWSSSFLEVGFSVCCALLYFQVLILGAWIFIRKLIGN